MKTKEGANLPEFIEKSECKEKIDFGYVIPKNEHIFEQITGVATDKMNNFCVLGFIKSGNFSTAYVGKYAGDGKELWFREVKYPKLPDKTYYFYLHDITTDDKGNIYLTGILIYEEQKDSQHYFYAARYDSDTGEQKGSWCRETGTNNDQALSIGFDSKGVVYITGSTWADIGQFKNKGSNDIFLLKGLDDGTFEVIDLIGTPEVDFGAALYISKSGQLYITGSTYEKLSEYDKHSGDSDVFILQYDLNDIENNMKPTKLCRQIGTKKQDYGECLVEGKNNEIIYVLGLTLGNFGDDYSLKETGNSPFLAMYDKKNNEFTPIECWDIAGDFTNCKLAVDTNGEVYIAAFLTTEQKPKIFFAKYIENERKFRYVTQPIPEIPKNNTKRALCIDDKGILYCIEIVEKKPVDVEVEVGRLLILKAKFPSC